MRILVTGSGAREHALAWRLMQGRNTDRVYCAPGNGGTGGIAQNVELQSDDVVGLVRFARENEIGLAVLGDDASVAAGVGDALRDVGVPVFGPGRAAGRIEASKSFAAEVMGEAAIPTPESHVFDDRDEALRFLATSSRPWVVKADGLARGKGVTVPRSLEEAEAAVRSAMDERAFGAAGARVLLQEPVSGAEVSAFALTDGRTVRMLPLTCDYKRLENGDTGPNTGGMGAYAPPGFAPESLAADVSDRCMRPLLDELSRRGTPYVGVVYAGLMLGGDGSWQVLEFNARFGDPECQVLMSLLDLDLPEQLLAAAEGRLESAPPLSWAGDAAVCLVLASAGYPGPPAVGVPIEGLHQLPSGVLCFHGGTRYAPHLGLVTSGGRVLSLVARGATVAEARDAVYTAAGRVRFEGARFRRDIGEREVERSHA